jgi:ATP-dependent exoDNAse (exonuclease V) beta subunit
LESGIPVLSSESLLLKHSPIVSFMVSLLRCIDYPSDELASAQVLEYLVSTKKLNLPLHECLKEFSDSRNNLSEVLKKHNIIFDGLRYSRLPVYQRCEELIACFDLGKETDSYLLFFLDEVLNYINSRNKDRIDFFDWWDDRSRKASIVVPEGMDAVTVMTIHKAKGLEFPVVLLPFANWEIAFKKTEKWIDFIDPEIPELNTAIITLNKDLLKTPFAEIYEEEKDKNLLDVMNVLYVAMTRPEQRLYIFTEAVTEIKAEAKYVSDFFNSALEKMGIPFLDGISEIGKKGSHDIPEKEKTICVRPVHIESHNWENRVRIRSTSSDHWDVNDVNGSRDKGNLLHEILADIETADDIESAVENAIQSGVTDVDEGNILKKLLRELISLPQLANCFSGKGKIRKEAELLLPDGKQLRPDRVIENAKETIILDYKTGEESPKYKKQLDLYAEVLKEMGYSSIQKKIVYTESLKVISW